MRPFPPVPPSLVSSAVFPLRSRPVRTPLLGLCFFLSLLQASASQWLPLCRLTLRSLSFPPARFLCSARLFQPSFPPAFHFGSPLLSASQLPSVVRFPPSFRFPPSPFGFFGPLPSGFGTRFSCSSFHRLRASPHSGFSLRLPSLSGSGLPLSFLPLLRLLRFGLSSVSPPRFHASFSTSSALGFGLLGIMIHPEN